jgi:hypothetical protein
MVILLAQQTAHPCPSRACAPTPTPPDTHPTPTPPDAHPTPLHSSMPLARPSSAPLAPESQH